VHGGSHSVAWSSGRPASARQNDSLNAVGQPSVDVSFERRQIESDGDTRGCVDLASVHEQHAGE